jgi:membrane fusion protein, copper/silver efflux system
MSADDSRGQNESTARATDTARELPMTRWRKFRLVVKVVELRLRFVALLAITGLVFAYWDTLWNRYDKWMRPEGLKQAAISRIEHYCPMHPQVVQDEPGSCPICGMPLARRKKGEQAALPAGVTARVDLDLSRVAQAGIETAEVAYSPLEQTLTTVGNVAYDERRIANIVSKVPGKSRVEKLYVNFRGQGVEVGQTLAELYSPELSQAIQELITAARSGEQVINETETAANQSLAGGRRELARLAGEKLRRWGITQAQIDEILRTGKSDFKFPILSPIRGNVVSKNVVEGQEVPERFVMFEAADLHVVWVLAQVYERQLGLIHLGQPVAATVEAFPGKVFSGKVEFIQPNVDEATRTVEVRYALDNTGMRLRPGMFATVTLKSTIADAPEFQTRLAGRQSRRRARQTGKLTVEEQKVCPVTDAELGTMGPPIEVEAGGHLIWTCCDACPPKVLAEPAKYVTKVSSISGPTADEPAAPLTPERQKICPVTGAALGSMGDPAPVDVEHRTVWTCCPACPPKLKADPAKYMARLAPPPEDQVLSVPESAVIDTGSRKVVYVEVAPGVFDGREVVLGPRVGNRFPVLDGLVLGEKVAARGAFLIDAESRINPGARPAAAAKSVPSASDKGAFSHAGSASLRPAAGAATAVHVH